MEEISERDHRLSQQMARQMLHAGHVFTYARLRDRHRRVSSGGLGKSINTRCAGCDTGWPCEVGSALEIIEALLVAGGRR